MSDDVNPSPTTSQSLARRRYDGSRRRQAAAQTRRAICDAARELFLTRGYAATTMPAIAERAGVAVDTVYASVGAKPLLFRELIEQAISGQDHAVPAEARDYVRAIHAEPDPRAMIAIYARAVAAIQPRLAPLFRVLREAGRAEPELAALWAEIAARRAGNMRRFVEEVAAAAGGLRPGMTVEEAADLVWATNAPEFSLLLVEERGWTPEQFATRLTELWTRMLLP
jgi:AcrR family transcriptional regulator